MNFSTSCPTSLTMGTLPSHYSLFHHWTGLAQPLFSLAFAALVCGFGTESYHCIYPARVFQLFEGSNCIPLIFVSPWSSPGA